MPTLFDSSGSIRWKPPPEWERKTYTGADLPPWELLVARSGAEGEAWVKAYVAAGWDDLKIRSEEAVQQVRKRRFERAQAEFEAVWREMNERRSSFPEGMAITERWYHSGVAFMHYQAKDFEAAWRAVDRAREAVERAVRTARFLLPMAHHCVEFPLLYARIARRQGRWGEVARHAARLEGLATDRVPLCLGSADEPVFMSTLDAYLLALPCLRQEEHDYLEHLLVKEARVRQLGVVARELYAPPGTVIPYP